MIEIESRMLDAVRDADRPADLYPSLQNALQLEHATVPLYLSAYFSLKGQANADVAATLRSVVREEMLHFAIIANVITALGGRPLIDDACLVPRFPGSLPMGVAGGLELHLAPMSLDQCRNFMTVEEPDNPVTRAAAAPDTTTIGDFYAAIIEKIEHLTDSAFDRPSAPQVVSPWFRSDELFAITDAATAVRGIRLIVAQGEGTAASPFEQVGSSELAHYYQFAEIVEQHRLVRTEAGEFTYTGDDLRLDPGAVYPMHVDPTLAPADTQPVAHRLGVEFCAVYRRLLASLQATFTGTPQALGAAMGLMYELRLAALAMLDRTDPADPAHCLTPTWEYLG